MSFLSAVLSVRLSKCLPENILPNRLSVCLLFLKSHLFISLFDIRKLVCQSVSLSLELFYFLVWTVLSVCSSVCLSLVLLQVCLSACLSISFVIFIFCPFNKLHLIEYANLSSIIIFIDIFN